MRVPTIILFGLAAFVLIGASAAPANGPEGADVPPPPAREFRGLWVATVNNSDWPSSKGLSTAQQQQELLNIFDRAVGMRLNAIIFQVRPCCDALYQSSLEPWSEFLTGQMGRAPSPFYDPLAFAVAEAHKRGLELHAWFNPFRARTADPKAFASSNHITHTHPELVRDYGKLRWLDPGEKATREHVLKVIMDVVNRYDIDGVHFDDYFYPYPEKVAGRDLEFPDDASWKAFRRHDGKLSRSEWRRENIDILVHSVYDAIKEAKPWVKFGISPFGIWRKGYPPQITGLDAYESLFSDSRRWFASGWVDYLSPQLYWPIDQKAQAFGALLQWWSGQNARERHLWPGMKVNGWPGVRSNPSEEAVREVEMVRQRPGASGEILWHAAPLIHDPALCGKFTSRLYSAPALVPASPWLGDEHPGKPALKAESQNGKLAIQWKTETGVVWQWLVREKVGDHWVIEILPYDVSSLAFDQKERPRIFTVCAVNRLGNLGPVATFEPGSHAADAHHLSSAP